MRNIHLSKFERVAGMFILFAILGSALSAVSVAVKQGWFEKKTSYVTTFESAEGVHAGASVKMAGLNAGSIEDVELLPDNRVRVTFYVLGKFSERVRRDSKATLIRPFIIGDRVLEVSVGSETLPALDEHAQLASEESVDLMTLMGGRRMSSAINRLGGLMENLETVAIAFADKDRIQAVIRMFDRMDPLIANLSTMSTEVMKLTRQATKNDNLGKTLSNVATLTEELNAIVPELNRSNPDMGKDIAMLTRSLGRMTTEMEKAMNEIGPDGHSSARRAVEALNEATVLMKALQKSFLLRSSVKEVRQEEKDRDGRREPAADNAGQKSP